MSGKVGDDHARNQVDGKMERTSRVPQRHRKKNWWTNNSIYIPHFCWCSDERDCAHARWMDSTRPRWRLTKVCSWDLPTSSRSHESEERNSIFHKNRKEVMFGRFKPGYFMYLGSGSQKDLEVWKVHRQARRKVGRTCKTSHGCTPCTQTSNPERMQKFQKGELKRAGQKKEWGQKSTVCGPHGYLSSQEFGVGTTISKIQRSSCTPRWYCERRFRIVCCVFRASMKDAPKLLKIPKSECPDIWIRLPRQKWPKSWFSMEDPVVPLERNLYGHPLAGLLWERHFEKILFQHGCEKVSNWVCLFVHHQKKGYSYLCMWMTLNWLERNKTLIRCGNYWDLPGKPEEIQANKTPKTIQKKPRKNGETRVVILRSRNGCKNSGKIWWMM